MTTYDDIVSVLRSYELKPKKIVAMTDGGEGVEVGIECWANPLQAERLVDICKNKFGNDYSISWLSGQQNIYIEKMIK